MSKPKGPKCTKPNYNEKAIESFKKGLREIDWEGLKNCEDPNEAYKHFLKTSISVYDDVFPKVKILFISWYVYTNCNVRLVQF